MGLSFTPLNTHKRPKEVAGKTQYDTKRKNNCFYCADLCIVGVAASVGYPFTTHGYQRIDLLVSLSLY